MVPVPAAGEVEEVGGLSGFLPAALKQKARNAARPVPWEQRAQTGTRRRCETVGDGASRGCPRFNPDAATFIPVACCGNQFFGVGQMLARLANEGAETEILYE